MSSNQWLECKMVLAHILTNFPFEDHKYHLAFVIVGIWTERESLLSRIKPIACNDYVAYNWAEISCYRYLTVFERVFFFGFLCVFFCCTSLLCDMSTLCRCLLFSLVCSRLFFYRMLQSKERKNCELKSKRQYSTWNVFLLMIILFLSFLSTQKQIKLIWTWFL